MNPLIINNAITEYKRLEAQEAMLLAKDSLSCFIRAAWPLIEPHSEFVPGWHIDAISDHLEAVVEGHIRNLLINIPPRHAKSTIVSVAFPAWVWIQQPWKKFIYASHAFSLSKRDSVKCRNLVASEWFRRTFGIVWDLAADQNEKMRFDNTEGGQRLSTSVGSSVIGQGGDILVSDDPHSPTSVRSEVMRESELEWIDQSFHTRINDPKTVAKIMIMQRLDEKDASAHVLKQGGWDHLMLPAEYEPERKCSTSIGWEDPRTERDAPLWENRFNSEELGKLKTTLGSKAAAGQLQQRPAPQDGIIFKRQWFKFYKEAPKDLEFTCLSVDLPFDEGGSFAVFQVWGRKKAERYLLDQTRAQVGFNEQVAMIRAICAKWPQLNAKWVEKKANGASILSLLTREIPGMLPVEPRGSKELRAEAIAPQFEAGNVYLPESAHWINDYVEELIVFNNGEFNDQVDATSQALMKLGEVPAYDWNPISIKGPSKWL